LVHERITRLQAFLQLAYTVVNQTVTADVSLFITPAGVKKAETFSATAGFSADHSARAVALR
jgi:hypothetical protein